MIKSLAAVTALAAFAAVPGAPATGVAPSDTTSAAVQLAVFGAGQAPRAPIAPEAPEVPGAPVAAAVPTPEQLAGVLGGLADPAVPFTEKSVLVEGGVGPTEAAMADHKLQKAARKGQLPLSFGVDNIQPAGPDEASADVTVSGPKLDPRTMDVTFVNQDGWKLSKASAMQLVRAASGK